MAHITQLGKFTVKPAEPENCADQSKLYLMTSRPIGIALEIPEDSCPKLVRSRGEHHPLPAPPPPPTPTSKLTL